MISERQFNRETAERAIVIDEVNTTERYILGRDEFNTPIRLSLHFVDPVVAIPKPGETWTAVRKGANWFLGRSSGASNDIQGLSPGDKRIQAQTDLHLDAKDGDIYLNGVAAGSLGGGSMGTIMALGGL